MRQLLHNCFYIKIVYMVLKETENIRFPVVVVAHLAMDPLLRPVTVVGK